MVSDSERLTEVDTDDTASVARWGFFLLLVVHIQVIGCKKMLVSFLNL